mgnify:CR=1 FL=1|jgi:hypothetical protein
MSEMQIAWLELILVGGLGAVLSLSGIIINVVNQRQSRLCTKQTEGVVVSYRFPGNGRMYPIVEYNVDGTCYKTRRKFRGVMLKRISGLPVHVEQKAYEDEKGYLHVKLGPIANLRQLAEQLWPIGSKMAVYYNPNAPQKCYVDRPIHGSFVSTMFIIMGLITVLLGFVVFLLVQL